MQRKDRMLGWPCCPSGQLYANARIDRLAYCPGQEVKISGNISNESGKQVLGSEVQLVQRVIFKAPQGKRIAGRFTWQPKLSKVLKLGKIKTNVLNNFQVKLLASGCNVRGEIGF